MTHPLLLKALARRDLSVAEAAAKLAGQSDAPALIAEAVRAGFLDDARLAARIVEVELARTPPPGPAGLRAKLEARRIDAAALDAALAAVDPAELAGRARAWLRAELAAGVPARKAAAKLARTGHAPESIEDWLLAEAGD